MKLWYELLARPRSEPPQKQFSKHPPQRYEDDAPPMQVSMGANFRLWKFDWEHVDFMNLLIRHRAVQFDFDTLQRTYPTHAGRPCSWIDWMNNQSISARKAIEGVLRNGGWEWRDGQWRKLPLVDSLPSFDQPWRDYIWGQGKFNPDRHQ